MIINTAQLHLTKSELRFCAGLNPTCGMLEICNGKNFWQWCRLEIRPKRFSLVSHSARTNHHDQHHHQHIHCSGSFVDCPESLIIFHKLLTKLQSFQYDQGDAHSANIPNISPLLFYIYIY